MCQHWPTGRNQGGKVSDPRVRRVRRSDVDAVVKLVHELAAYERASAECTLTAEDLEAALFGAPSGDARPALFAHVAEVAGEVVGCALWFLNFSTWRGTHGIYLEDLFVRPQHRQAGLGKALLTALAEECVQRGYARLEWSVLDWNEPSIGFYRSLGAVPMEEWTVFRLTDDALTSLGTS
ncbi:GNAT family N-acetyltransferase [Actinopolymorpha cephalotaxi]|uniref:GNAT family N-acetyltransferase n=1 Tax=Actinopolymorpha cephalotaxi TaxID=504797 RepID=UPI000B806FBC|nr:GNAT family N-acetyltransferase [Actinopolymorpha cephalotaxi]